MELHALIYLISISLFCLRSTAVDITWTTLPFTKPYGLCCFRTAFDNNTGFVWLLGGYGYGDIYKWDYMASDDSFTHMGSLSDSTYGSWGQDWVTKDNIIYYVDSMDPSIYSFDITSAMEIANDLNASFPFRSSYPCVTTDDDAYLIIVGGGYGVNTISTRIYNFETAAWLSNTPNLNEGRASHSCNVYNGHIYAIGGWNINNHETKTVEKLNLNVLSSSNWITLDHQLNTARYQHRSVLINDFIIVTGGNNNGVSLKSVELISMVDGSITPGTDLNIGVWAHGIIRGPMNNVIVIGGGTSGSSYETWTIQVSNAFAITDPNTEATGGPNDEPTGDTNSETTDDSDTGTTTDPNVEPTDFIDAYNETSGKQYLVGVTAVMAVLTLLH